MQEYHHEDYGVVCEVVRIAKTVESSRVTGRYVFDINGKQISVHPRFYISSVPVLIYIYNVLV